MKEVADLSIKDQVHHLGMRKRRWHSRAAVADLPDWDSESPGRVDKIVLTSVIAFRIMLQQPICQIRLISGTSKKCADEERLIVCSLVSAGL